MSNMRTVLSILRSALSILLTVLLVPMAVLTVLSVVLNETLVHQENYTTAVQTAEFAEQMNGYLRDELESECLFYDLPFSVLDDALSIKRIETFSGEYAATIHDALFNGSDIKTPSWDAQPFVDAVQKFFDSLPQEKKPFDETAAVTVGTELSEYAVGLLKAGVREAFLEKGHQLLSHPLLSVLLHKMSLFLWMTIVCAAGVLLCHWEKWKKGLYAISFALGISSVITAAPLWLLKRYELMERLALADSPLKLYIEAIFNSILFEAAQMTGICFVVSCFLVLLAIVLNCVPSRGKNCTQNVHTDGIDDCN